MTKQKPSRPGMGAGGLFMEMAEKKQLADFCFWGRAELVSGGAKRRRFAAKVPRPSTLENQELPTRD
ncbi:MAG: hypothetical protein ABSC23_12035 [Bryobacteraceae bacterium]|jgi:hypothetical protein